MIERYQTPEIERIFSEKNRFALFIEIEALFLGELSLAHPISREEIESLRELKKFIDVGAINDIEKKTRHEITAFLDWAWLQLPRSEGLKRFLHLGLTSSDLNDTALGYQCREAFEVVEAELERVLKTLKLLSLKYKDTPTIGRTHGIHAEPTTLGFKFLGFLKEGDRNVDRLKSGREAVSCGKLSGSVGNFFSSLIDPAVESKILVKLGLKAEPAATQIVARDRYAHAMGALALLGGWMERIAMEIRHLQRTEVAEAFEPFGKGQEGSSSMPHKRNPILCENICGLARLLRSQAQAALENMALWHERDISHSSVERVIIPDAFHAAHFGLKRLNFVLSGLEIDKKRIKENASLIGDLSFSQNYLNQLIIAGWPRQKSYKTIQEASSRALKNKSSLWEELVKNKKIKTFLKRPSHKNLLNRIAPLFRRS